MDRLSFDAPFLPNAATLPVRMQAERTVSNTLLALWRHVYVLTGAVVLALAAGAMVLAVAEKRYSAEALVQFDFSVPTAAPGMREQSRGVLVEAGPMIQGEARIVNSRPMARRVVETLGLADDPAYAEASPGLADRLTIAIEAAGKALLGMTANQPPVNAPSATALREERIARAVDQVMQRLSVTSDSRSYLLSVTYSSPDPVHAARVANTFAEEYLRRQQQASLDAASSVSEWMAARVRDTTAELRRVEAEIAAFRAETGLLEPGRPDIGGASENVDQQRLRTLTQQLNAASLARLGEERRLARVQEIIASGSLPSSTDIPGLPLVAALLDREATLRREMSEASARFGPRHPDVRQAQAGLAEIRGRLHAELERALKVIRGDVAAARRLEEDLQRRLDAQHQAMVAGKQRETELRNLLANAQSLREHLADLHQSSELAAAASRRFSPIASLAAPADPPRAPAAPRPRVIMALALLGGMSTGVGAALFLEWRDRGLRTGDDVRALGTRCLGMVPEAPAATSGIGEQVAFYEAIYAVGASVNLFGPSQECRVVLVTSSVPGEGQSMLCRELARALTDAGKRVMLIGNASPAELQGAQAFSPAPSAERDAKPELPVPAPRLVVLERRRTFNSHPDVTGPDGFGKVLEEARRHFDVIILEGEPVMLIADSLVLGHLADNIIHVARWAGTRRRIVVAAQRRMQENAIAPDGLVLTHVNLRLHAQLRVVDECSFYDQEPRFYESLTSRTGGTPI
ncbi:MAG: hypothetical protein IRY87_02740 [Acetobacteraceae bacterium]|nr:hypothetical protein [Acetobacteraceae bacterium]